MSQICDQEPGSTAVVLSPFGDVIKLSFEDSGKYAGILALPILCKLKIEFAIEYTATIALSDCEHSQRIASKKNKKRDTTYKVDVRIVIYGAKAEQSSVSQILSDAGLYLQHPLATELCKDVEYWNPHLLLRPGSQMPKLGTLSISMGTNQVTTSESIEETQKNRFMQIFNSANGPNGHSSVKPSSRLKTVLTT